MLWEEISLICTMGDTARHQEKNKNKTTKQPLMEMVVKHWNHLSGEVVEYPSLQIFNDELKQTPAKHNLAVIVSTSGQEDKFFRLLILFSVFFTPILCIGRFLNIPDT